MMIWGALIIGNLNDKWEDVDDLIKLSKSLPLDLAQFTIITPYPGTELHEFAKDKNLIDNYDFTQYCESEPTMHTPNLSRLELLELDMKAYLKFYGPYTMLKRVKRWSNNPKKRWVLKQGFGSYWSFMKMWGKSGFYFIRNYKNLIMDEERIQDKFSRKIAITSTPKLFSITSAIIAFLIAFFLLSSAGPLYDMFLTIVESIINLFFDFFTLSSFVPLQYLDLIIFSALLAGFTAFVATWNAVIMYRHGWVLSLKKRSSKESTWNSLSKSLKFGLIYGVLMVVFAVISVSLLAFLGLTPITYEMKVIFLSIIAFLTVLFVSYKSVHGVRNTAKKR
jgi:hypothetical protein